MDAGLQNTRHKPDFYPMKLKSVNLLRLSDGNHTFYFLSLVVPTCCIHVFSSCIQQGANNPLPFFLPLLSPLLFFGIHPVFPFFLNRPWRILHTARVSLKSCQDMFCCQRDAEWERIRYRPWCVPDKKQAN